MADKKTQLMAQFYEMCRSKGYVNMHDDKQSLKAKVIATDLNLKYKDIVSFFEKAKQCYEQVQKELTEEKRAKDAENARRSVAGVKLVTILNGYRIDVFRRPDGSYYSTVNDGAKIEGQPKITIHKSRTLSYDYHAPKAVYTGATVGGVTTGGVHVTQGGYSERSGYSGNGYLQAEIGSICKEIDCIRMSEHSMEKFKRDDVFKALVVNKEIRCHSESSGYSSYMSAAALASGNFATQMTMASMAVDAARIPYAKCVEINNFLDRVMNARYPASDEELYERASTLAKANNTAQLQQAIKLFEKISDFRDSTKRLAAVKRKYEDVLQEEKERAVLLKEASQRRNKKLAAVLIPGIVVLIIGLMFFASYRQKQLTQKTYQNAVAMLEAGDYDGAIAEFEALGEYGDAGEMALEAMYQKGMSYMKPESYSSAIRIFQDLGNYKDSAEQLALAKQQKQEADNRKIYELAMEKAAAGEYENACQLLDELRKVHYADSDQQKERVAELWYQEMLSKLNDSTGDGDLWVYPRGWRDMVWDSGGYRKAQAVLDYFGEDPMQEDTLYWQVRMACLEGRILEAKALLEESSLLDVKAVNNLYEAIVKFAPYCGDFICSGGDRSVLTDNGPGPADTVRTWVKFTIQGEENRISGFQLWIQNGDNRSGGYNFATYDPDTDRFLRSMNKSHSYTVQVDENGSLVFKQYRKGQLSQPIAEVTYALAGK